MTDKEKKRVENSDLEQDQEDDGKLLSRIVQKKNYVATLTQSLRSGQSASGVLIKEKTT